MKNYKSFIVETKPFNPEIISGLFWELKIDGITENENSITIFAKEEKNIDRIAIEKFLVKLKEEELIKEFLIEENIFEDKNWNEEWESKVNIIEVSEKIVIKPSFKDYSSKPSQIVVEIDPKMSFGTGEHETTKLVLKLLEKYVSKGNKVLDVGCGTGVLAIAAVKLGANNAIAFDNDEWCLLNGNENVKLNKLQNKIEVRLSEIQNIKENNFDLITANINKHILLAIKDELQNKTALNGYLILSGLLNTDEEDILKIYETNNFELVEKKIMNEWVALIFRRIN